MNYITPEQIKEYVNQNPTGITGMSQELSDMVNHFAERIVRECVGVCEDARDSTDYVTTVGMADHCALAIANRFGVK